MNLSPRQKVQLERVLVIFLFLLPTVVGLGLFQFVPLISALRNSFYNYSLMMPDRQLFIGLDNYIRLFGDSRFLGSLKTTVYSRRNPRISAPIRLYPGFIRSQGASRDRFSARGDFSHLS